FREGASRTQPREHIAERFAIRGGRRSAPDLFQCLHEPDAGRGELMELMIELRPLSELPRSNDHGLTENIMPEKHNSFVGVASRHVIRPGCGPGVPRSCGDGTKKAELPNVSGRESEQAIEARLEIALAAQADNLVRDLAL